MNSNKVIEIENLELEIEELIIHNISKNSEKSFELIEVQQAEIQEVSFKIPLFLFKFPFTTQFLEKYKFYS